MKKKKLLLIICLGMIKSAAPAQAILTPTVMSPAGDYFVAGGTSLSFTLAEMTAVESLHAGNTDLGQGFQNAYWIPIVLPVEENGQHQLTISMYPNPCSESLQIKTGGVTDILNVKLFDVSGKLVISHSIDPMNASSVKFPIAALSNGIYLVTICDLKHQNQPLYKSKITIIHTF